MRTDYEWDCETVADGDPSHEDGEVIDHAHGKTFRAVAAWAAANPCAAGGRYEFVLVRDDDNGRSWAYLNNGKLPEYFKDAEGCDAAKVPKRFHAEIAAEAAARPSKKLQ